MVTACVVVVELALLEAKLFDFERFALTLLQAIEDLTILGRSDENRACALDGLLACGDVIVGPRDLACEEIQMSVCESQAFGIELAMLGDELAREVFAAGA